MERRCAWGTLYVVADPLLVLSRLEGVPSAVAAARAAADAVLRDRGARVVPVQTSARALLAGARASAAIEGAEWEPGAVRLSTELLELAGMVRRAPAQVLARAHALVAKGMVPDAALGVVRTDDRARLQALLGLLSAPTGAPALVQAAVAHAEVAQLAPFGGGDGIIARAVEHMVLVDAGVDPRVVLLPEEGHRAAGPAYEAGLRSYPRAFIWRCPEGWLKTAKVLLAGENGSV
jgi:Fic family protein